MFSGLNHFPNQQITIDSVDPVPGFMSRKWQGYQKQQDHADAAVSVQLKS